MTEAVEKLSNWGALNIGGLEFAKDGSPEKASVLAEAAPRRCFAFFNRSLRISDA